MFLNAEMVAKLLGISPPGGYELMHEKGFPSLRIGSRPIIRSKDGRKRNGSLLYTIRPIEEAVQFKFKLQLQKNTEIIAAEQFQKQIE